MQPEMYQVAVMVAVLTLLILAVACANLGGLCWRAVSCVSTRSAFEWPLAPANGRNNTRSVMSKPL